jgi:hypothetical protein
MHRWFVDISIACKHQGIEEVMWMDREKVRKTLKYKWT